MKKENSLLVALPVLFGFFVMGFCDIVGRASDYVQQAFGWSHAMTGLVPSMVFIWFLVLGIPAGIKMNRWGRKNTVLLSMGITIAGMLLPLLLYNAVTCMVAFALLGIGNAILQVSLNPLLKNVLVSERLLTSSLTAGQVVKALSSFAGPYILLSCVELLGHGDVAKWYYCFPVLGAITLLSALWLVVTPVPRETSEASERGASVMETLALLKDKTILLLFLGIFFVVGVDVATNFISSKVMITRFGWEDAAGIAPQIYFTSRVAGALLGVFLMTRVAEMRYFKWNILAAIVALFVLAFTRDETINLVSIGAIGFFCSCIFSIIYSMAVQARPEKTNRISGLMITAIAGGAVVPPVLGLAMESAGIEGGILVILLCACYLAYCAFGVKIQKTIDHVRV
ncbi:MAG: MFS transporter [Odoribacteraceae bacterium]|jgi:fucose permease|nr:MFS transporter [Odoribacteraceae bacterium]